MSDNTINTDIYDAISNVMKECNVKKESVKAGTAGTYNAFLIDNVLDSVRPLLASNKLIMSIKHKLLESQHIEVTTSSGTKAKHNVIVETVLILKHKSGAEIEFQAIGEASDFGDKGVSKAQTDGYKKIITQMFALSDGEDKDKNANDPNETITKVSKKDEPPKTNALVSKKAPINPEIKKDEHISNEELTEIEYLVGQQKTYTKDYLLKSFNISSFKYLKKELFAKTKSRLEKVIAKENENISI